MQFEQRKDERFDDIGRVDAPELCVFPGVLVDISMLGCRIRFPASVTVDMDSDIDLKITSPRKGTTQSFSLIGHPKWIKEENGSTEVGFRLLRSPGSRLLYKYIEKLAMAAAEYEEEEMYSLCVTV